MPERGDGRIFKHPRSRYIYCAYYDSHGKEQREVCRDRKGDKILWVDSSVNGELAKKQEDAARKYLKAIVKRVSAETLGGPVFLGPDKRRMTVNELLDGLEAHYKLGGKKRIPRAVGSQMRSHLKRVRDHFGDMPAVQVDKRNVEEFMAELTGAKGLARATVNRSLQLLRQAFTLAHLTFPDVEFYDESDNVRKGKFDQVEVERLLIALPKYLADVAEFAYGTGARAGEILKLRWSHVKGDVIYVPGEITKNGEARQIALDPNDAGMTALMSRRRKARLPGRDFIFHNEGHQIRDYRKAWQSACVANGLGRFLCRECINDKGEHDSVLDAKRKCSRCGKRFDVPIYEGRIMHDFRRTAAYEMWKAGNSVDECMEVTGHKSDAMFKGYADIFSDEERHATQRKVQEQRRMWREAQIAAMVPAGALAN